MRSLVGRPIPSVDDLAGVGIDHIMDWPKSEIAAALFGANEPSDRLVTTAHELVIIDSEQMFSTSPGDPSETNWWSYADGRPSASGRRLTRDVCRDLCMLSELNVQAALQIPEGIIIDQLSPIAPILMASREVARRFLERHP
jgi:hypothetical protein